MDSKVRLFDVPCFFIFNCLTELLPLLEKTLLRFPLFVGEAVSDFGAILEFLLMDDELIIAGGLGALATLPFLASYFVLFVVAADCIWALTSEDPLAMFKSIILEENPSFVLSVSIESMSLLRLD